MKINEITEDPMSDITPRLQGIGSKILSKIPGMKGHAANLAARADLRTTASNVYSELVKYLGSRNKKINQIDSSDVKDFFNKAGLDSSKIPSRPIDKQVLKDVIIDAAIQIQTGEKVSRLKQQLVKTQKTKPQKTKVKGTDSRPTDPYEKAKSVIRQLKPRGDKPVSDRFLKSIGNDIRNLSKGDKDSGVIAAQKILSLAQSGRDVRGLQQRWIQSAKVGERFLTQSIYRSISKYLQENNLRWQDLGLKLRLIESKNNKKMLLVSKV